jgi:hypothetical protein
LIILTLQREPDSTENHFRVFEGDRYVGRIYQANTDCWFWSLARDVTAPDLPPYGWNEPTREAAMERLKATYAAFVSRDNDGQK